MSKHTLKLLIVYKHRLYNPFSITNRLGNSKSKQTYVLWGTLAIHVGRYQWLTPNRVGAGKNDLP